MCIRDAPEASGASSGSRARRLAMTAHTISCIWWNSISGSTAREACAPNRTLAMGSPEARDFFEPANWMAIRSSRPNPSALAPYQVSRSIAARRTASTASRAPSRSGLTWCQMPRVMPSLKAV